MVCIGMSVGGIIPPKAVFRALLPQTSMAFVVIHHAHTLKPVYPTFTIMDENLD